MRIRIIATLLLIGTMFHAGAQSLRHPFDPFPVRWDEGIPLGNGMLGALLWQKGTNLRISLDRADLWDNRPMKGLHREEFRFDWVQEQVRKKEYDIVQAYFDHPYDREPAPTKIPGAALELPVAGMGPVTAAFLEPTTATATIEWQSGARLHAFVHATRPMGWFRLEQWSPSLEIELMPPAYQGPVTNNAGPVVGDDLSRLGYAQGTVTRSPGKIVYSQNGWGGFSYEVTVMWQQVAPATFEGTWTISSFPEVYPGSGIRQTDLLRYLKKGFQTAAQTHRQWWEAFWNRSSLDIPDSLLLHQWHMEMYKFGSAARRNAPPVSLQAVWTADNGRIPPWKGDFHHDLNTQLSYWPAYSGNHLEEALGYLDYFEKNKANFLRYTQAYFGKSGIAVPGVTTLDGTEMGGWIQYALSPTVSAWIAHHYYLQWRYSMDKRFLKNSAYPWIAATARFLEELTVTDSTGARKLPLSSSPEINDNDIGAWFTETTNYDLALMKFNFKAAAELARELGRSLESEHWKRLYEQLPDFALSQEQELLLAPGFPYGHSHRHFSNLMAIHPLGLLQWEHTERDREIIQNSLRLLEETGPKSWTGYSYAWLANLMARAKNGEGALRALDIFARAFCSPNTFHLNGDQTKSGYSNFTYRPFTLEGNFAFAAGLQEMLLQSHAGYIELLPAIPASWEHASFRDLRAEGAFLVSTSKVNGVIQEVRIKAEKGGLLKLKATLSQFTVKSTSGVKNIRQEGALIVAECRPGAVIRLIAKGA